MIYDDNERKKLGFLNQCSILEKITIFAILPITTIYLFFYVPRFLDLNNIYWLSINNVLDKYGLGLVGVLSTYFPFTSKVMHSINISLALIFSIVFSLLSINKRQILAAETIEAFDLKINETKFYTLLLLILGTGLLIIYFIWLQPYGGYEVSGSRTHRMLNNPIGLIMVSYSFSFLTYMCIRIPLQIVFQLYWQSKK